MTFRKHTFAALVGAALVGAAAVAGAQQPGGMMGAQGSGMGVMGAPGAGAGPGMMGGAQGGAADTAPGDATSGAPCPGFAGYGTSGGVMNPVMMQHMMGMMQNMMGMMSAGMGGGYGMMGGAGGYGMGPGMMGGAGRYGMASGMMAYGPLGSLDLNDEQRTKIAQIYQALQTKRAELGGKVTEQRARLRALYSTQRLDRDTILRVHKNLQELRLDGLEAQLDAREKIEGVLTTEQRQQLRRWGPWWMMG